MAEQITFLASLPPILSAITRSGNGDGMRVKLDIPESEFANAVRLLTLQGKTFEVTISLQNRVDQGDGEKQHNISTGAKRKSRRESPQ